MISSRIFLSKSKICFAVIPPSLKQGSAGRTTYSTLAAEALDGISEISAGPSVKLLLNLYRIPPQKVAPTGPHGRLLKGDVLGYISSHGLEPRPFETPLSPPAPSPQIDSPAIAKPSVQSKPKSSAHGAYIDHELTSMRKTIAKRLTQSKYEFYESVQIYRPTCSLVMYMELDSLICDPESQIPIPDQFEESPVPLHTSIPHAYSTQDICTDKLVSFRKKLADSGFKCSVNDIIIKAVGKALRAHQSVNSLWNGKECETQSSCDVSVAVATENGLITPIVKSADSKSLSQISSEIKELAVRARQGRLRPVEFLGGSFTISNLGMMGITEFSAVINPPQACILAIGSEQLKLNGSGSPTRYMTVCLSADRRCVDEAQASEFLKDLSLLLEEPYKLAL